MFKNKCFLNGRIGQNPKLEVSSNDNSYVNFSIAENYKSKKSNEEMTRWHDVVLFGNMAAHFCQNFKKGDYVSVEAYLEHDIYTTNDGKKVKTTSIIGSLVSKIDVVSHQNSRLNGEEELTADNVH